MLDNERLKNGSFFNKAYFDNLLEEIREIRASERRFYQKITDIYALAMDYNPDAEITQTFFATVQNKLHFAIHGYTASELIVERADSRKDKMGLTTWKNAPHGKILKPDVSVAKNYLTEKELKSLDRIVSILKSIGLNKSIFSSQILIAILKSICKTQLKLMNNRYQGLNFSEHLSN